MQSCRDDNQITTLSLFLFGLFIIRVVHPHVFLNGGLVARSEAAVSPIANAVLYGKGVFTTVAINDGQPFLWEKHWRRIQHDARKVGLELSSYSEETVRNDLDEIIKKNSVINGHARITSIESSVGKIWDEAP